MASETDLFGLALGLQFPWRVERLEFSGEPAELHLYLESSRGVQLQCPECDQMSKVHDRAEERVWRHLNFFQYKAFLHARVPRTNCRVCGVKTTVVPWSRPESGFTLLFEAFALMLAKQMPVSAAARILAENDTRLWRLLEHHVAAARTQVDMREARQVGVDETSSKRGHKYVTVMADLEQAKVLFVTEGRDAATLTEFKTDLESHGGCGEEIEAMCMDMSPAFISGVGQEFPRALPVFDRFHVMKLVNAAVDQVRRLEVKQNAVLKETRFIWLKNPGNLTARQKEKLESLSEMNLATATAYQMKLNLQELWTQPDRESAEAFLETWYQWVMKSDIAHVMKKAAQAVKGHATGILNYFNAPLTNGLMEGINSLIQAAKAKARGFRSTRYFKIVIYLIGGKLDFRLPSFHTR